MNGYIINLSYILLLNLVTFVVYGIDKYKAKRGKWRIAESTLLLLALLGGSIGAWLAMKTFHHKTMHKKFYIGVPVIIALHVILAAWAIHEGYLFCK